MKVIYEVNLAVQQNISEEFCSWLDSHVEQMLDISGFLDAQILFEDSINDDCLHLVVHYHLDSRQSLESYFEHQASKMRQEGWSSLGALFLQHGEF